MPFNLEDYEPVEERLAKFWADHPMGRISTELVNVFEEGYVVKASIWRGFEVKSERPGEVPPPGATGYAQETVGSNPVNRTSALENCETSAIGRALANLGYAPKGKRPSREELQKSAELEPRTVTPSADPESTRDPAGMGDAEGAGDHPGGASPAPTSPAGSGLGEGPGSAGPNDKADLSFHPNTPHKMIKSPEFPDYLMCSKRPCPYWEYVGKEK